MIEALAGIGAAFGLSGSAGLNAYIPLLIVAVASRYPLNNPLIDLAEPYNLLSSPWIIVLLSVLLIIEMLADKIPVVDSINAGIQLAKPDQMTMTAPSKSVTIPSSFDTKLVTR